MSFLRISLPKNSGELTHVLAGKRITIGRRPDNTIQIVDGSVSGHHAELIAVDGHYRLHDLESTNLTMVDGQPITDYHLHQQAKICFGNIECEFSPEVLSSQETGASEVVPTRSELEFLRRENHDLQAKLSLLQNQINILSSARLVTTETTQMGVAPEAHRRVATQRDQFRDENETLKHEVANLKSDLNSLARERDAMRQAWETVKTELGSTRSELATLRFAAASRASGSGVAGGAGAGGDSAAAGLAS